MSSATPPEPIAIVGMACRLPGGVGNPKEFWEFLVQGQSGYADFPPDRLNIDAWHHDDANRMGSFVTRGGYFLDRDLNEFDHDFFNISAVEASTMDPAQKQLLEVAYEACEAAGVSQEQLSGSMTGVYVGNFCPEQSLAGLKDMESMTPYTATGTCTTMLSNRINYVLDLKGPSLTIDTACASSAYALHMACAGLRARDCDAALVGAANTIRSVEAQMFMSKVGALSPTSKCHTFDARADGYARADGITAVYLMRLSDAIQSNRPIRAVIRGTAIGANGSGKSLTRPNGTAQTAVIRKAYENAGISDLETTGYFECHGTGTPIGDRIETRAVADVFSVHRTASDPLLIGSVKTNLGHSEGAAALTALIKTVLAIEANTIPPTIGIEVLNPNIHFDEWKIKVVQEPSRWPKAVPVRRASINSFGFGGANAHIVIEEADAAVEAVMQSQAKGVSDFVLPDSASLSSVSTLQSRASSTTHDEPSKGTSASDTSDRTSNELTLIMCSAKNEKSLDGAVNAILSGLRTHHARDIAVTLAHRSSMDHRAFAICDGAHEPSFQRGLKYEALKLGFTFTGGGAQWPNMGQQLLQFPAFRQSIRQIDDYVATLPEPPNWTIEGMMLADVTSSEMDEPRVAQFTTAALEIGLVDLLADWGVRPSMVAGHSAGEIAAAYAAGYLTHAEASAVAYYRGKATSEAVMKPGAMLAVGLSAAQSQQLIPDGTQVCVGAINSPESVTLSGDRDTIEAIKIRCENDGIFNRIIASKGVAYHSVLMEPAAKAYSNPLAALPRSSTNPSIRAKLYSSVIGRLYTKESIPVTYWRENMENPVLFAPAVAAMREAGMTHVVEIGPHSTLRSPTMETIKSVASDKPFSYSAAVKRNADAVSVILNTCGDLALAGVDVDVSRVNNGAGVHLPDFPKYLWSHQSIVQESRADRECRLRKHPRHDLLGSLIPGSALNTRIWRNVLSQSRIPWLSQYKFGEDAVFPASGFICLVLEAMRQTCKPSENRATVIERLGFGKVLLVNRDIEIFLTMRRLPLGSNITSERVWSFDVSSVQDGVSTQHCQGCVYSSVEQVAVRHNQLSLESDSLESQFVSAKGWYDDLAHDRGIILGDGFRRMNNIIVETTHNHAVACIDLDLSSRKLSDSARADPILDPLILENCFNLPLLAAGPSLRYQPYLTVSIDKLAIYHNNLKNHKIQIATRATPSGLRALEGFCHIDVAGETAVAIQGLRLARLARPGNSPKDQDGPFFWRLTWVDDYHGITKGNETLYFPPEKYWPKLYTYSRRRRSYLAQMWVVQFAQQYPDLLLKDPISSQHKHFLEWINWLVKVTMKEHPKMCSMSQEERHSAIQSERTSSDPGIELSWLIYDHLRELIEGTHSALDLVAQSGLLSYYYETQLIYDKFERVVEMIGLQNPSMRILEIGAGTGSATRHVLKALTKGCTQQYSGYTFTDISPSFFGSAAAKFSDHSDIEFKTYNMENTPEDQGIESGSYDLVIASCAVHITPNIVRSLRSIRKLLKLGGTLLLNEITAEHHDINFPLGLFPGFYSGYDEGRTRHPFLTPEQWAEALPQAGFAAPEVSVNDVPEVWHAFTVLATTAIEPSMQEDCTESHITIVSWDEPSALARCIQVQARKQGAFVTQRPLIRSEGHETNAELNASRLIFLTELEDPPETCVECLDLVLTNRVSSLIQHAKSLLWVVQNDCIGRNRPAPRLRLRERVVQDSPGVGLQMATMYFEAAADRNEAMAQEVLRREYLLPRSEDTEFHQFEGRWLIPRLLPDQRLTQDFARLPELDNEIEPVILKESGPLHLSTRYDGSLDALAFEKCTAMDGAILPGYLEVEVKAVGMNMTDLLSLTGKHGTGCFSSEFAGIIVATADNIVDFQVGDTVFGLWPGRFGNLIRVPKWLCQKTRPGDAMEAAATLPQAYCTAWYAIVEAGRTLPGDRILIQSASGGVGMAAIIVARSIGAEVYATAGTASKRATLRDLGIPECRIFSSREVTEHTAMRRVTGGHGFDVVLNTSSGDYLHTVSWPMVAPFGRFVELRSSATLATEGGIWNLGKMSEGASIIPVDISRLCVQRPGVVANVMEAIGDRYRSGAFTSLPYKSFPVSQLGQAYADFSRFKHTGKLVLTYDDSNTVPFLPMPETFGFDHNGTYVLIGALGWFTQKLARWMVQKGARRLIIVGPPEPAHSGQAGFLGQLMAAGVAVAHIEVKASNMDNLRQVLAAAITSPLRGVIDVAGGLEETLKPNSEIVSCEEGTSSWQSTTSRDLLRSIIVDKNLSFDFLASLNTVANSTSYREGPNTEHSCRYQEEQYLPWTSIFVMPTQDKNKMLGLICAALLDLSAHALGQAQETIYILPAANTGKSGDQCSIPQQRDARWAIVDSHEKTIMRRAKTVLARPTGATPAAGAAGDTTCDLQNQVMERLSKLLWIRRERLGVEMSLQNVGIDSMIASEFRSWIQQTFNVSISIMELVSQGMTIGKLAKVLIGESKV